MGDASWLAKSGFSGHGGAEDVGSWIWQALNNDIYALIAVGKLKQIEDLPLFIEGIDKDITSDITTRIIFEALADFTAHMIDTTRSSSQAAIESARSSARLGTSLRVTGWTSHSNCP
ncbi:hypothetical protein GS896_27950 [Rhodococcus hoagii]|nr:hypothetical protein [Prescottella equi]